MAAKPKSKTGKDDAKAAPKAKTPKAKTDAGKKPNALSAKVQPSGPLVDIVGDQPIARSEVVSRTWDYIKKHKLQNPADGREILADAKLEKLFGKKKASMFEMNKFISSYLK